VLQMIQRSSWVSEPSALHLDRIANDGNHEPGNYRWATANEQRRNQDNVISLLTRARPKCKQCGVNVAMQRSKASNGAQRYKTRCQPCITLRRREQRAEAVS
jgi:hypothetical protein